MQVADLKVKTDKELLDLVTNSKKELMNLRFQQKSGELKNTARKGIVRKEIARILTVMNQKKKGDNK